MKRPRWALEALAFALPFVAVGMILYAILGGAR